MAIAKKTTVKRVPNNRTGRGAPVGNQFWKLRSKHGRDILFSSAAVLWEEACKYFEWCDKTPLISIEYYGKDAKRCRVPKMRAYTLQGLCIFLDCNTQYITQFENALDKSTEAGKDFSWVIARIREIIYTQKFEGAAAGLLNANIITRDLGLSEKTENTNDTVITGKIAVNVISTGIPLANSEAEVDAK